MRIVNILFSELQQHLDRDELFFLTPEQIVELKDKGQVTTNKDGRKMLVKLV